jgi:hypothetical protein
MGTNHFVGHMAVCATRAAGNGSKIQLLLQAKLD